MDSLDRIRKAHVAIMQHKEWCEYSSVLACGDVAVRADVPTAYTDGWNVVYGDAFVQKLSDAELRFVVLHENTHKAYRHLTLYEDLAERNPALANYALDAFINLSLHDMDAGRGWIKMPATGVPPIPKFRGWSSRQIFEHLLSNAPPQGQGFDDHDWEAANAGDEEDPGGEGDQGADPASAAGQIAAARREAQRAQEIQRALQQGADLRRKRSPDGAGLADGAFGDLLTPKVPWRTLLREFLVDHVAGRDEASWRKPSRRHLSADLLMPGWQGVALEGLVIGFDTSGSCFGSAEMTRFVTEVTAMMDLLKPRRCHVIYWDTRVSGHQTFEDGQFAVQSLRPKGGGGTDGSVLFDYLRAKRINPTAVVQLTDGYVGDWGRSEWPTLWAVTSDERAPYGTTIRIEDN